LGEVYELGRFEEGEAAGGDETGLFLAQLAAAVIADPPDAGVEGKGGGVLLRRCVGGGGGVRCVAPGGEGEGEGLFAFCVSCVCVFVVGKGEVGCVPFMRHEMSPSNTSI
jgi:hypothetical protein